MLALEDAGAKTLLDLLPEEGMETVLRRAIIRSVDTDLLNLFVESLYLRIWTHQRITAAAAQPTQGKA